LGFSVSSPRVGVRELIAEISATLLSTVRLRAIVTTGNKEASEY
jgi:hypothetical protein